MTPLLAETLIAQYDWRLAWLILGLAVWLVVIPIALFGMRDRPAALGQWPDGRIPADTSTAACAAANWGVRRGEAMRQPFFWVVTGGVAVCGLLGTAVNFHQISLLGERGLTTAQAAANFIPQTVAALVATLATGMLADRVRHRWLIIAAMASLAGGLAGPPRPPRGISAVLFGALIGAAGGSMRALEAATFPRYFGTRHIGSIRGMVAALSVASTAFGPTALRRRPRRHRRIHDGAVGQPPTAAADRRRSSVRPPTPATRAPPLSRIAAAQRAGHGAAFGRAHLPLPRAGNHPT